MSIQGSINSIVNTAGAASAVAMLNPAIRDRLETKAELKRLDKQEAQLTKQFEQLPKPSPGEIAEGTVSREMEKDLLQRLSDVKGKRFELNPTERNYGDFALHKSATEGKPLAILRGTEDDLRADQAMEQMEGKKSAKQNRRNFIKDYLAKQTSSLGGKVGDLPKNLQKQIASQYTKSQRTAMMDRMDKQNGNK